MTTLKQNKTLLFEFVKALIKPKTKTHNRYVYTI